MSQPATTILIVDDDRGLLRLIEKTLRREGFLTATAASGQEAIAWLGRHHADLLLLDLKLADMAGGEVIQQLARTHQRPPFIVITGQGDERVAVEMMKQGALDYLVKDREFPAAVPAVIQRALKQVAQERKLAAAEEQVRLVQAAVQQARDAVLIITAELPEPRIVYANPAFEYLTGLAGTAVAGQSLGLLSRVIQGLDHLRAALPHGQPVSGETTVRSLAGNERVVEWQLTPVRDARERITHWVSIQRDITERKRLETEILEIGGREQRRIGQDLHDGLGQHLAGLELMSQVLEQKLAGKSKTAAALAAQIARHVRDAMAQTRALARGLTPVELDANGLMAALQDLALTTQKLFPLTCQFHCLAPVLIEDATVATQLYRIVQEAINNAVKHGKPKQIAVLLIHEQGQTRLSVADDGLGFPAVTASPAAGMGLRIMRHRAESIGATLDIRPAPGGGTLVTCTF